MAQQKNNVAVFDRDVRENAGYRYTTHARYSSVVANERITRATLRHIDDRVKRVLDAGCGDGTYTQQLKASRPLLEMSGFDPAVEAINVARRRHVGIQFETADILRPETFPPGKFDLVIVRGVLHHLSDPAAAIRNCANLSDRILIIEPNGNNPILKLIEKFSVYHREHEEQSFSSRTLKAWCRDAGFAVSSLEFIGFVPFFFPGGLAKLIHFFQPFLERFPLLGRFFGAQIVLMAERGSATQPTQHSTISHLPLSVGT